MRWEGEAKKKRKENNIKNVRWIDCEIREGRKIYAAICCSMLNGWTDVLCHRRSTLTICEESFGKLPHSFASIRPRQRWAHVAGRGLWFIVKISVIRRIINQLNGNSTERKDETLNSPLCLCTRWACFPKHHYFVSLPSRDPAESSTNGVGGGIKKKTRNMTIPIELWINHGAEVVYL